MTLGNEGKLLTASLTALKQVIDKNHSTIIESEEISRTHRVRLEAAGFLEPIMQGWYAFARPGGNRRVETAWGSAYWEFVSRYLEKRFGEDYWLNPVGSLRLHAENYSVPSQLMICVPGAVNGPVPSPPNTLPGRASLYISGKSQGPSSIVTKSGLRIMSPEAAIANLPVGAWAHMPTDVVSVLGSISGSSSLLRAILDGGLITRAGAAAGALRHIGRAADADRIISTISGLGHDIREEDPLSDQQNFPTFNSRKPLSAAGTRIKLLWSKMRDDVLAEFVEEPRRVTDIAGYLAEIDDRYVSDAYNSLSIEGYKVTAELIEKVKSQNWKPETNASDFETHNALAAQGYWLAFNEVKKDVKEILEGADVSALLWDRHQEWFKAMFQPFVTIGQQKAHALAGYRNGNVFIIGSDHVPYSPEAVTNGMDALFDCIADEEDPRVKSVLGPYIFTFIHPYMDGNGRNARFLMNALLAEGGFPWTVVPVERRNEYMACLEAASKNENIKPLAAFVAELVASPSTTI
jgi:fido (protein-threonine AMPylation protein)